MNYIPRRRSASASAGTAIVTLILAAVALFLIATWETMLGIGIIHAEVLPAVHPIGYGTTFLLVILFSGVFLNGRASSK